MSDKKRGQNFTEKDVQILIKICNKYKKVIECKKTDALTNKDKEDAWRKVTKDFHSLTMDSSRTVKQLQEKYKAVKKKMKSDFAKNKQYAKGTGGGPYVPPPAPKTDEEKELLEAIKLSVEGLTNPFDNDGMSGSQGIAPEKVLVQDFEDSGEYDMIDVDWTSGSATLWQTPKHPSLKAKSSAGAQEIQASHEVEYNIENDVPDADKTLNDCTNSQDKTGIPWAQFGWSYFNLRYFSGNTTKCEDEQNNNIVGSNGENNNTNINGIEKKKWQSRRRPVLNKKKTVSSAGAKFERAAEKKIELIGYQKLVAEAQLLQSNEEHQVKMQILEIQKQNETLKCDLLKQGKMVFEF